jgi:hypothetical protein
MMAAAIAGVAIFGILSPTWAKVVIRPGGNVVHKQLYDSTGKPVNCLPARALGLGKPPRMLCRNYKGVSRCDLC